MRYLILASLVLVFIGCSDTEKNIETSNESIVDKTVQKIDTVVNNVKEEIVIDGQTIFSACATCHGINGEKKALNVSNLLQGQSKNEIITKLNGYKNGTYGGAMKGVMSSQAKILTKEKIEALGDYISKF